MHNWNKKLGRPISCYFPLLLYRILQQAVLILPSSGRTGENVSLSSVLFAFCSGLSRLRLAAIFCKQNGICLLHSLQTQWSAWNGINHWKFYERNFGALWSYWEYNILSLQSMHLKYRGILHGYQISLGEKNHPGALLTLILY